jgi:hypothetical protein
MEAIYFEDPQQYKAGAGGLRFDSMACLVIQTAQPTKRYNGGTAGTILYLSTWFGASAWLMVLFSVGSGYAPAVNPQMN